MRRVCRVATALYEICFYYNCKYDVNRRISWIYLPFFELFNLPLINFEASFLQIDWILSKQLLQGQK